MRVLTVRQPWAWAIIHGGKTIENRVRNIAGSYRGPVAIHAGKSDDLAAFGQVAQILGIRFADYVPARGAIIGVVDLVDVHGVVETAGRFHCTTVSAPTQPNQSGACSVWADPDATHLVLSKPRPLADPIPFRGALGLRHLDPATIARIEAQLTAFRPDPIQTIVTERLQ